MLSLLVIPACVFINRLRGGGYGLGDILPGHTRLWAAGAIGLLVFAFSWGDWKAALVWAAAYLFWACWPLNRWDDLDPNETKGVEGTEGLFEELAGAFGLKSDAGILFVRHASTLLLALTPVAAITGPAWLPILALPVAGFCVLASYIGVQVSKRTGWKFRAVSEPLVGLGWGVLVSAGISVPAPI